MNWNWLGGIDTIDVEVLKGTYVGFGRGAVQSEDFVRAD